MRKGFTLIEVIITISLIVILTGIFFFFANPAGQLASSRNSERKLQLQAIMNAIRQDIADQSNEQFSCSSGALPTSTARMTSRMGTGTYNIAPCIVFQNGQYGLFTMPFDPSASSSYFNSTTDYDSGYSIVANGSGSITLSAPNAELRQTITITR